MSQSAFYHTHLTNKNVRLTNTKKKKKTLYKQQKNIIRQYTYRDDYDYSRRLEFDGTPKMVKMHADHCIEELRKLIMCVGDVTPLLVKLNPKRPSGTGWRQTLAPCTSAENGTGL